MRSLLRALAETGASAGASLLLGVISVKIMAVILGPAGTGLYALLQQILSVAIVFSTLSGGQALVQGVSARSPEAQATFVASTAWVLLVSLSLVSAALVGLAPVLSGLAGDILPSTIRLLVLPLAIGTGYIYLSSLMNGHLMIREVALVRIAGSLATALLVLPLAIAANVTSVGYILLLCSSISVQLVLSLLITKRKGILKAITNGWGGNVRASEARRFVLIAASLMLAGLIGSGAMLMVTTSVVRHLGFGAGGVFNAAWSLSGQYVLLILTSLTTYYLPALARLKGSPEGMELVAQVARLTAVCSPLLVTAVVISKPLLVTLLYSSEYNGALSIVRWMLLGDYLKIAAWVLAMPALAFADMKTYLWTELIWFSAFSLAALVSVLRFDSLEGVGVAFAGCNALYLVYYLLHIRRRYDFALSSRTLVSWLLGLTIIAMASVDTWSDTSLKPVEVGWIVLSAALAIISLSQSERHAAQNFLRSLSRRST